MFKKIYIYIYIVSCKIVTVKSMHHYSIICVGKKCFQCFAILYNMLLLYNTNHAHFFIYDLCSWISGY